jgi:hypothetical protein
MSDLTDFLNARLSEDEWKANAVKDAAAKRGHFRASLLASAERDLRECEAKRRIIDLHDDVHDCVAQPYSQLWPQDWGEIQCPTLRLPRPSIPGPSRLPGGVAPMTAPLADEILFRLACVYDDDHENGLFTMSCAACDWTDTADAYDPGDPLSLLGSAWRHTEDHR